MPAVRKNTLLGNDWWWRPFFDAEIQVVLERRRRLPQGIPKHDHSFLRAWPILTFEITTELASEISGVGRHEGWLWCYKIDRQFAVDLLAAVTRFNESRRQPPEEWNLRRAMVEVENSLVALNSDADSWMHPGNDRLLDWKEVASWIEEVCPHLRGQVSAERLRKSNFYKENKRRTELFKKWRPNLIAWKRYGRDKWFERRPCDPVWYWSPKTSCQG